MLAIEYLKLKIWMRMHYKIIGITFHKKKISSQTEKLTFLKIAAKLATSRSLLWGSIFLSGLSLLLTNLSLKLPT